MADREHPGRLAGGSAVTRFHPRLRRGCLPSDGVGLEAATLRGDALDSADLCPSPVKPGTFLPMEMALLALGSGNRVYVISLLRDRSEHRG